VVFVRTMYKRSSSTTYPLQRLFTHSLTSLFLRCALLALLGATAVVVSARPRPPTGVHTLLSRLYRPSFCARAYRASFGYPSSAGTNYRCSWGVAFHHRTPRHGQSGRPASISDHLLHLGQAGHYGLLSRVVRCSHICVLAFRLIMRSVRLGSPLKRGLWYTSPVSRLLPRHRPIPFLSWIILFLARQRLIQTRFCSTGRPVALSHLLEARTGHTLTSESLSPALYLARTTKTVAWATSRLSARLAVPVGRRGTSPYLRPCRTSTRTGFMRPRSEANPSQLLLCSLSLLRTRPPLPPLPPVRPALSGPRSAAALAPATTASPATSVGSPPRGTGAWSGTAGSTAAAQAESAAASRQRPLASSTTRIEAVARRGPRSRSDSDHQGARRPPRLHPSHLRVRETSFALPCRQCRARARALPSPLLFVASHVHFLLRASISLYMYVLAQYLNSNHEVLSNHI
jgi:hypothetical protein